MATIIVTPTDSLLTAPTTVELSGLRQGDKYLLSVKAAGKAGHEEFTHTQEVFADHKGCVTLNPDATDIFIARMSAGPDRRFVPRDPEAGLEFTWSLSTTPDQIQPRQGEASEVGRCVVKRRCLVGATRELITKESPYGKGNKVRGALFVPQGEGPFPVVLDMFGSAGGLLDYRAALLASHGFITLGMAQFKFDDLGTSYHDLHLEPFVDALRVLLSHPKADAKRGAAIVATSFGTQSALLLARLHPDLVSGIVWISGQSLVNVRMYYKGDEIKALNLTERNPAYLDNLQKHATFKNDGVCTKVVTRMMIEEGLGKDWKDHPDIPRVPIEETSTRYLCIAGEQDLNWPSHFMATEMRNRMEESGCGDRIQLLVLPGAGHLIEPPGKPFTLVSSNLKSNLKQSAFCWGGSAETHPKGERAAWAATLEFLRGLPSVHTHTPKLGSAKL